MFVGYLYHITEESDFRDGENVHELIHVRCVAEIADHVDREFRAMMSSDHFFIRYCPHSTNSTQIRRCIPSSDLHLLIDSAQLNVMVTIDFHQPASFDI